jgi:hypothetical protein
MPSYPWSRPHVLGLLLAGAIMAPASSRADDPDQPADGPTDVIAEAPTDRRIPVREPVPTKPTPPAPAPEPVPVTTDAPVRVPEPADDLAALDAAPPADEASGMTKKPSGSVSNGLLWIPRAALFVPRWAFWLAVQPLRGVAWATEEYHLAERYHSGLIVVGDRFGLVPTASYGGGFGPTIGVKGFDRNLFGDGEKLVLSAKFGGEFSQAYGAKVDTGKRLGRIKLGVGASYERRPHDRFSGIGNEDYSSAPMPVPMPMLIDPSVDSTAVVTRFRQEVVRVRSTFDAQLTEGLSAHLSGAYMNRQFDGTERDDSIETAYDTSKLAGYATGVENVYLESELVYDTRIQTNPYVSNAIDSTGWYAGAHIGAAIGVGDDTTDYQRYGFELQRFFDLYKGSRVISVRAMVDGVFGTDGRTDGKIAFTDLPRLGGTDDLRGYTIDRFRDRTVALASAEYTWAVGTNIAAFTFVDAGRTAASIEDLRLEDLHLGFGGGLQLHTRGSFVARAQMTSTQDGDLGFQLALSPSFDRRERTGRK